MVRNALGHSAQNHLKPELVAANEAADAPCQPAGRNPAHLPGLQLVAEHPTLLVFNKPAGLLSVPGKGEALQDCLSARVQALWPEALVVHRLDMATSGLIVMARGPAAQRRLSTAFAERQTHKRYEAVVWGHLNNTAASPNGTGAQIDANGEEATDGWHTINLPLTVDWPNRPRSMVSHELGKPSITRWRVLEHSHNATRLALQPVTGRSHQLRVHLQALGHPILGDALYATPQALAASPRLLLHATQLSLPEPDRGNMLHFHSAAPF